MSTPSILTIILNFRTPDLTIKAAEAALREMRALGGEVLIVDNGSGDGSFEAICAQVTARGWNKDGDLRVVESPQNGGFGAGNNFGMAQGLASGARPDLYYLLNSDAWPDEGAVGKLLEVMQAHPCAGMAGSHIRGEDGGDHCTVFRFPSIAGEFEGAARLGVITRMLRNSVVPMEIPAQTTQVDWTAGASLLIRRAMLDEVGGFDETFFLYYEETELCHRAARAGWQTYYVPGSRVVHVGSASTGLKEWARTPRYWFDSRMYYFAKLHGRAYAVFATLARIMGGLIWRLRRVVSHRPLGDPPGFLRDLTAHAIGAAFHRPNTKAPRPVPPRHPITEESK
ncbi:glycosyltransferase family 2 protein [Roseovarius sp. 2305UL8-3]|uniref:glycosyltransferase family 2 protein n=1 Tax=Roseovarius conchicola TaxID=3121636 RepID=UPI00352750CD